MSTLVIRSKDPSSSPSFSLSYQKAKINKIKAKKVVDMRGELVIQSMSPSDSLVAIKLIIRKMLKGASRYPGGPGGDSHGPLGLARCSQMGM